jgi:hypothetical protein
LAPPEGRLRGGEPALCVAGSVGLGFVSEPRIGPFLGLDVGDAVELGELLAFLGDWLAGDPNRLDASLYEFVGVSSDFGSVCGGVEELRAEVNRFAGMLLGCAVASEEN